MGWRVEVKGLKEAQRKMDQTARDLSGTPIFEAMRDATLVVVRSARQNAPVDTGRLRASIMPEVVQRDKVITGIVGSNVTYAPYMELGTRPHWPPLKALEVWARRHNTVAFVVARAIAKKGTKARKFLWDAVQSNRNKIAEILSSTIGKIIKKRE
jgi:HK97 gp10 family phage protein